jgi:hypothetical protein
VPWIHLLLERLEILSIGFRVTVDQGRIRASADRIKREPPLLPLLGKRPF